MHNSDYMDILAMQIRVYLLKTFPAFRRALRLFLGTESISLQPLSERHLSCPSLSLRQGRLTHLGGPRQGDLPGPAVYYYTLFRVEERATTLVRLKAPISPPRVLLGCRIWGDSSKSPSFIQAPSLLGRSWSWPRRKEQKFLPPGRAHQRAQSPRKADIRASAAEAAIINRVAMIAILPEVMRKRRPKMRAKGDGK